MTYEQLLDYTLSNGIYSPDRTGTGTYSVFGPQLRFDLTQGFPMLTTKKLHFKSIVHELLWFIAGDTNVKYLQENGVKIWDAWANENGDLGPIYGAQFHRADQLNKTIEGLKNNPNSRRHVITLWNPEDLDKQALHCCHGTVIQFYVRNGELSCSMYQRSADLFLGIPFNIASYALFTHMVAQVCGYKVKELVMTFGDAHIYSNHLEQVKEQLTRDPKKYPLPQLELNSLVTDLSQFKFEDIALWNYQSYPSIKAPVAV